MDGQTPDRFTDSASHTMRAVLTMREYGAFPLRTCGTVHPKYNSLYTHISLYDSEVTAEWRCINLFIVFF